MGLFYFRKYLSIHLRFLSLLALYLKVMFQLLLPLIQDLWEDVNLTGVPVRVYLRGRLLVDGERWLGRPGGGRFLHRQAGAPVL